MRQIDWFLRKSGTYQLKQILARDNTQHVENPIARQGRRTQLRRCEHYCLLSKERWKWQDIKATQIVR